jgi:UDP-3-O-[3-hydroxymyristoyl] glucosamine N-acyltransferase
MHHTAVADRATIGRGAYLGEGVMVMRDARIGSDAHLEKNVIVLECVTIGKGSRIRSKDVVKVNVPDNASTKRSTTIDLFYTGILRHATNANLAHA